ncbi:hypothetical protein F2Q70_00019926 [Brassica cretica]|uniref:PGG domain-containing protein n=1 Tax=Brassica cretica TaxID=69181 RepID=A0A8S9GPX4_BRACR|nr:hypothetical protein F2Q70_00019926 [Brassica cretica]
MDRRLQQAAESGSISDLYALIDENPCILENIDAMPFVNTPLHIAAASGKIAFAVEMLNLKPSFAKKLNTNGCSPLHLAVEKDQQELVTWLLRIDPSLAGVKGREGITLFHLLVLRANVDLVVECLITSPECIKDVSVNGQNALHLAVVNERFEVLQVLTGWIQRMSQKNARSIEYSVLNKKDLTGNTPLHRAAYKNDHQMVKLLLECRMVQRNEVNGDGLTFLDILRTHGQIDEGGELEQAALKTGCMEAASLPKLMKKTYDFFKSPITFWAYCSTHTRRISSDTSDEARGVFLIICTLLITATYQTSLQPPGGVTQSEGHAVMKQAFFIVLWVSNTIGFCCALFYTYSLLPARGLLTLWFCYIGASLCVSYALAMAMVKLLLECRMVQRNEVNGDGLTFLDILRRQGQIVEGGDLEQAALITGCKEAASLPKLTKKTYDFFKLPITFWAYCSTHTRRISSDTSDEARGVFLIICTLLITATYQTSLQPPGGVTQSEGHAVMKQTFFIVLWVSNTIGFCCAIFYTFCLLPARAFSVSHRGLCLVPSFSSLCFDGSFPKAMAEPSNGST